jgi:hypothetical protein
MRERQGDMIREKNNPSDRNVRSFDEVLLEAIDAALASLGESVKQVIYYRLETRHGIRREEIPSRLQEFQDAIVEILGTGSRTLENLIVNNLYSKLGLSLEPQEIWTLAEYVNHAKKHMKAK